jgi:hypothetical protein
MDNRDLVARREALIADLERLATGWAPDAATLAAVPHIEQWSVVYYPGTHDLALCGIVVGHPRLPDGPVTTSPIMAIDLQARWIRTHGRFYVLGKRAACKIGDADDCYDSETRDV